MLITVVVPTKNRKEELIKCLRSIFCQSYKKIEVIVVDDGSKNNIEEEINDLFDRKVVYLKNEYSKGAAAARNKGWRSASGDYIAFLDDDDIWDEKKIELQVQLIQNRIFRPDLVFCGEGLFSKNEMIKALPAEWNATSKVTILERNVVGGTSTAMVRRDVLIAEDGFDEALPSCQDWDLFLRIAQKYRVDCVAQILVQRHVHGKQISTEIDNRIKGRKTILAKHFHLIQKHRSILSQHYRRLGCLEKIRGEMHARKFFLLAVKADIASLNSWVCLLCDTLLPRKTAIAIFSQFALSRFGDIRIYH